MEMTLLAKSSSRDKPYTVDFINKESHLLIKCNCPSGKFGKFCKHKIRLLKGDYEMLYDEKQNDKLGIINEQIQKSEYLELIIELSKSEKAVREAEKKLNVVKKKIAHAMKTGLLSF